MSEETIDQKKAKRYTKEEKQEILDYVAKVDLERGRGGATAASKKFGVSQLTISSWKRSLGLPPARIGRPPKDGRRLMAPEELTTKARRIMQLAEEIDSTQERLLTLRQELAELKATL